MNKVFENISIKGRVGYGINCLENAIKYNGYKKELWGNILEQLWKFTDVEYIDDWYYQMAEFMPDSILEKDKYDETVFEYISKYQFYELYDLYTVTEESVLRMLHLIFEIGSKELYGKIQGYSEDTLLLLDQLLKICKSENIDLPNKEDYMQYKFEYNGGWGESFEGRKLSLLLNS